MSIPVGTEYLLPIQIDHHRVVANYTGFLFQIDLTAYYTSFTPHINDTTSITVYDQNNDSTCTKLVEIIDSNMYLYFLGNINTTNDAIFYICAGKSLNYANTTTIFSSYDYTNRWGFNGSSETIAEDSAGSYNGTIVAPAHKDPSGFFGKCLANHEGVLQTGSVLFTNPIISTTNMTIEAICKFNDISSTAQYLISTNKFYLRTGTISKRLVMSSNFSNQATSLAYLPENEWCHIIVTRTSSGVSTFYINGINRTDSSNSGTPETSTTNMKISNSTIGADGEVDGCMDEVAIYTGIKDSNFVTTRYRSMFDSTFLSISPGFEFSSQVFYRYKYRIHY